MKAIVTLGFVAMNLFATPVQGDQYLSDAQKELLWKQSSALRLAVEKANAQGTIERTNIVEQKAKFLLTVPKSVSATNYRPASHTLSVVNNARPQTQSLQSMLRNMDWGTPTYSNNSVSNRSVQQSRQVAKTAPDYQSFKRSQQVSKPARKNINWSGFFQNLSYVANAVSSGLNQANSQFYPYIQQPNNLNIQQPNNQIIHTYRVGNQSYGVGGNQNYRSYDVGNITFGGMGDQEFRKFDFSNMSIMKTDNGNLVCRQVSGLEICN